MTDQLNAWNSRYQRWSWVRLIANSRLPQMSAFIPAIGYALLWSDQLNDLLGSTRLLGVALLPPVWKLQLLWWGSISMTIGWSIYALFCPSEIRRCGEPDDYVLERFAAPSAERARRALELSEGLATGLHPNEELPSLPGGYSAAQIDTATKALDRVSFLHRAFEPSWAQHTDMIFKIQWHIIDKSRQRLCLASLLLLAIGALMFLIPSVEVALRVLRKIVVG